MLKRDRQRNIILYDFFEVRGGAERLVISLCDELLLDICLGFWSKNSFSKKKSFKINYYNLDVKPHKYGLHLFHMIVAFKRKTRFLNQYCSVIFSGAYSPLAVFNHPKGKNIYYCHTPPRFIYDKRKFYLSVIPKWQIPLFKIFCLYLKKEYEKSLSKMDTIVVNSKNTQKRVKQYLKKDAIIIHPPCNTNLFRWKGQGDYYLSTARLARLKRVDIIIEAFKKMPDKKLVVSSGGTEYCRLKRCCSGYENILFTGWVNDAELLNLIGKAIATIYIPENEDFGMSPVESMAAGKPVIGVNEGGLKETVIHGKTGLLINADPSPKDIISAVHYLSQKRALSMRSNCEKRAKEFDQCLFIEKIKNLL